MGYKSTNRWRNWWAKRKIDWDSAYGSNPEATEHPHRKLIVDIVRRTGVQSLMEVGCGAGVNLIRLKRDIPSLQVGGCDISEAAILKAQELLPQSKPILDVRDATELFFSDKSVDMALADATLIYLDGRNIRKALKEIRRVTRRYVMFVELHEPSFLKRLAIKLSSGYSAYDYRKLLEECDFHDITVTKLPKWAWDGPPWSLWGHVIFARI